MNKTTTITESTLPPGKYLVCDPCYVLADTDYDQLIKPGMDLWEKVREITDPARRARAIRAAQVAGMGVREFRNYKMAVFGTAHGDGIYECTQRGERKGDCLVDSGMISAIPLGLVDEQKFYESFAGKDFVCPVVVELTTNANCADADGELHFGDVRVDTSIDEE